MVNLEALAEDFLQEGYSAVNAEAYSIEIGVSKPNLAKYRRTCSNFDEN